MQLGKLGLASLLIILTTGCKLAVIASAGGYVESASGVRDCASGNLCEFQIDDLNFTDSFTAVPNRGYIFDRWRLSGLNLLCTDPTNPTCSITNANFAGNSEAEVALAAGIILYATPVFQFVGIDSDNDGVKNFSDEDNDNDGILDGDDPCPNNPDPSCGGDTITVDGTVWYQPALFKGASWDDVNQACPGGPCAGTVGGIALDGWTWASDTDIAELFEFYDAHYAFEDCPLLTGLMTEAWNATNSTAFGGGFQAYLLGWTSNGTSSSNSYTFAGLNSACGGGVPPFGVIPDEGTAGAFFYYQPSS